MFDRRVERQQDGRYALQLADDERALLRSLPDQLLELLETDDPSLARLFPPAYAAIDDGEHQDEYQRLMGSDLADSHRAALRTLRDTVDAAFLSEEDLGAWLAAINEFRLVLGTQLDMGEQDSNDIDIEVADIDVPDIDVADPRAPGLALYYYLSSLQEDLVQAATEAL
jgi:hypothetical protein